MKIETCIETNDNRIHVVVDAVKFTATEQSLMDQFGEPMVEVGGTIYGPVTVVGWQVTKLSFVSNNPGVTIQATAAPILDPHTGAVTYGVVTSGGEGYTVPPTVTVTGDGTGAQLTAVLDELSGVVSSLVVMAGGVGYHDVPWNAVYQLPTAQRRLQSDFPVQRIFDRNDYADAEAMAMAWANTMQARMTAAIQDLRKQTSYIEGETAVTV